MEFFTLKSYAGLAFSIKQHSTLSKTLSCSLSPSGHFKEVAKGQIKADEMVKYWFIKQKKRLAN